MVLIPTVLFLIVVISILVGLHFGPHSSIGSGSVSLILAVMTIAILAGEKGSLPTLNVILLLAALALSGLTVALGIRGVRMGAGQGNVRSRLPLLGQVGVALTELAPTGAVLFAGEQWSAESISGKIHKGENVLLVEADQIHLKVIADSLSRELQIFDSEDHNNEDKDI